MRPARPGSERSLRRLPPARLAPTLPFPLPASTFPRRPDPPECHGERPSLEHTPASERVPRHCRSRTRLPNPARPPLYAARARSFIARSPLSLPPRLARRLLGASLSTRLVVVARLLSHHSVQGTPLAGPSSPSLPLRSLVQALLALAHRINHTHSFDPLPQDSAHHEAQRPPPPCAPPLPLRHARDAPSRAAGPPLGRRRRDDRGAHPRGPPVAHGAPPGLGEGARR